MTRLLSALALAAPVLAVLLLAPPAAFLFLVVPLVFRAGWELQSLLNLCGGRAAGAWQGALDASAFALAVWAGGFWPALVLAVVALRALPGALSGRAPGGSLALAGAPLLGAAWVGGAGGLIALLRDSPGGREAVFFLLVVVWANDMAAMFTGRAIGRRKLAPRISPAKTVEGAIGGVLAGVLAGAAAARFMGAPGVGPWLAALASALIGAFALAGDLAESALKRAAGRKDASDIIPGHGGLLDRIDGLLAAAPAFYYFLHWARP